jgi:hypothetical protein
MNEFISEQKQNSNYLKKLKQISIKEVSRLDIYSLIKRMDDIIDASYTIEEHHMRVVSVFKVSKIMDTKLVRKLPEDFQRKIAYKAFETLWQWRISDMQFHNVPHYYVDKDLYSNILVSKQLYILSEKQWQIISLRIVFELLRDLTYMVHKGVLIPGKNKTEITKKWLKEEENPFTFFALSFARSIRYSRQRRDPEIHNGSNYTNDFIALSLDMTNDFISKLSTYMHDTWQHLLKLANDEGLEKMVGWVVCPDDFDLNEMEWFELVKSDNREKINEEVDKMFRKATKEDSYLKPENRMDW